jgi:predicted transcriptional regulator
MAEVSDPSNDWPVACIDLILACAINRRGEKTAVKKTVETTSSDVTQTPYVLTPEEKADIDASLAEAARGEFATEEEVLAVWANHGL